MCTHSVWCWKFFAVDSPFCHRLNKDQKNLVHWFRTCIRRKTVEWVIDPFVIGKIAPKCLRLFISIAELCLLFRGAGQLSMDDVVNGLQRALHHQETSGDEIKFGAPDVPPEEIHEAPSVHTIRWQFQEEISNEQVSCKKRMTDNCISEISSLQQIEYGNPVPHQWDGLGLDGIYTMTN